MPAVDCPDAVMDLPPSAKLVYALVAQRGPLTMDDLRQWLPLSTVHWALDRLEDAEAIETRPDPRDPNTTRVALARG